MADVARKLQGCGNRLPGGDFEAAGGKNRGIGGKTFGLNTDKIIAGTKLDFVRNYYGAGLIAGLDFTAPNFDAISDVKKTEESQAVTVEKPHVGFKMNFEQAGKVSGVEIKFSTG